MRRVRGRIEVHVTEPGCPLKGIRQMKGVEPTNVSYDADRGTFIHKVMEDMVGHIIARQEVNVTRSIDRVKAMSDDLKLIESEDPRGIVEVCSNGYRWLEHEGFDVLLRKFVGTENTMRIPYQRGEEVVTLEGEDVYISGTPDLILTDAIIDWKSGKTRSKGHALQLSMYSAMFSYIKQVPLLPARIFYMSIPMKEKVIKSTGAIHKYHERCISPEQMEEYIKEWDSKAFEYVQGVEAGLDDEPDPEDCSDYFSDCFFCPYRSMCWGEEQ